MDKDSCNKCPNLPIEILQGILAFVDARTLATVQCASRLFYQLSNQGYLWDELCLSDFSVNVSAFRSTSTKNLSPKKLYEQSYKSFRYAFTLDSKSIMHHKSLPQVPAYLLPSIN